MSWKVIVHIYLLFALTFCPASATTRLLDEVDSIRTRLILIDKSDLSLLLLDSLGYIEKSYSIACGLNKGNKEQAGDFKTPEGIFYINRIVNSACSYHDFKDGEGPILGAFGPWFLGLETPPFEGIGIHGTHLSSSIGIRSTEGCIRLKNEDVADLKHRIRIGTPVVILPDESLDTLPSSSNQTSSDIYVCHDPYQKEYADSVCLALQRINLCFAQTSECSPSASDWAARSCKILIDVRESPHSKRQPHYLPFRAQKIAEQRSDVSVLILSDPQKIPLVIHDVKHLMNTAEGNSEQSNRLTYDWKLLGIFALFSAIVLALRLLIK